MGLTYQMKMKIPFDMADMNGHIKLPDVILLSLQVSGMQSIELGVSDKAILEDYNLVWIITDYDIEVARLPRFAEEITIETEALSYNRLFCYRRFTIYDEAGQELIHMMATFVLMDRDSRKVHAVEPEIVAPYQSDFDKKISTSRSRAISFSVVVQNLEQLKAVYEKTNETIIGNCDTLLFLGSPSYSTLEYFSKQLGEKTITHYNVTHNRKAYTGQTTGYSDSDQIMGRALMTPDELRRMEGDKCIILERGVKPIKADKYYYYEDKTYLQQLKSAAIDHNAYECTERGNYRIFNPNNPYVDKQTEMNNTKIEELMNDLFVDASKTTDNSNDKLESSVNTGNENAIDKFINEDSSNSSKFILDSDDDTNVDFEDVDIDIGEELRKKYAELFADDDNAEF